MDLEFKQTDAGIEFRVKASPGSSRNAIRGIVAGAVKISVTVVAEKGKANSAIVKLLSKQLGISKSQIKLVAGLASSQKKVLVSGIELATLKSRLELL
ncbi:MAG: DUF167 domain-containing protein [Mariniblastus sp.]